MNRAYSLLNIRSVDDEKRIIEGVATTPTPDRAQDVIELDGIEFKLPLPFLLQHNTRQPIGKVIWAKAIAGEMRVKVQMAAAGVATFIDEAWSLIKAGLIPGLSIGFRPIEDPAYNRDTGGFRFIKTEWVELSAVTIPMNAEATITSVKSADALLLAASGTKRESVRLDSRKQTLGASRKSENTNMLIAEQIKQYELRRATAEERMTALMSKSADESRTLDATESEEYDGLLTEVKQIDEHIVRLKAHEKTLVARATAVTKETGAEPSRAAAARGGHITVKANVPPGTAFTRYAMALACGRGSRLEAAEYAKRWKDSTPEVEMILRAAVTGGTVADADWAAPLVVYQNIASEFVELLRPQTIIGRIPGITRVPFNVQIPKQTQGSTVAWVGETKPKPVSELKFGQITLGMAKAAGIVVLSEELVRSSSPSAEAVVRADMTAQLAQFLDAQFVDPSVAVVTGVHPASITNGITPITASGVTADALRADVGDLFQGFITAGLPISAAVWLMPASMAVRLSLMQNALSQPEFPGLSVMGGTFMGLPVIISENIAANAGTGSPIVGAGARIILVIPREILLADDGGVELDVSREASIQMDSAPTDPVVAATVMVSLWQTNQVGLRAERFINWARRRDAAVGYIDSANYA